MKLLVNFNEIGDPDGWKPNTKRVAMLAAMVLGTALGTALGIALNGGVDVIGLLISGSFIAYFGVEAIAHWQRREEVERE